jgi:hypothetical protein
VQQDRQPEDERKHETEYNVRSAAANGSKSSLRGQNEQMTKIGPETSGVTAAVDGCDP